MDIPTILIDNQPIELKSPPLLKDGKWLVPLESFSELISTKVEYPKGTDTAVICGIADTASGEELCVQLKFDNGTADAVWIDGIAYALPSAVVEPFGFRIHTPSPNRIEIVGGNRMIGKEISAGHLAPDFTLPDLNGKPRRLSDFQGKKTLLYLWASW